MCTGSHSHERGQDQCHEVFPLCFQRILSKNFIVLGLMVNSLGYFELLFVYAAKCIQSHSFASGYPIFPTSVAEVVIFSQLCIFGTLVKGHLTINAWIYFWGLYYVSLVYVSVFMRVPYCFKYYSFIIYF